MCERAREGEHSSQLTPNDYLFVISNGVLFMQQRGQYAIIKLRYGWCMPRIPSECACGNKFNIQHALSCKKGGFITLRHNEVRDITASFLNEVCKDVRKEPSLIKLTGEQINEKATKTGDEARLWVFGFLVNEYSVI